MAYNDVENIYAYYFAKKAKKVREENGLQPLNIRDRNCLCCEKKFMSLGNSNRLCPKCRNLQTNKFEEDISIK